MRDTRTSLRGRILWVLRVAVALGLLGFLGFKAGLGRPGALVGLSLGPIALGLLIVPVSVAIRAFNHTLLLNARMRILSFSEAFRLTVVGAGMALVLPPGAADAVKAHYGFRRHGHAENMIVSSVLDKLTSVTAVAFMGAVGGTVAGEPELATVAFVFGLLTLVPFAAPGLTPWHLVLRVLAPGHTPDPEIVRSVSRPPLGRLSLVLAVSVLGWLTTYAIVALACAGVGAAVTYRYLLALAPFATLARMVPISLGGIGLGEFTTTALLVRSGVPGDLAARASLLAMVLLTLVPGAAGVCLVLLGGKARAQQPEFAGDPDAPTAE